MIANSTNELTLRDPGNTLLVGLPKNASIKYLVLYSVTAVSDDTPTNSTCSRQGEILDAV
jgi:hypothetical protein